MSMCVLTQSLTGRTTAVSVLLPILLESLDFSMLWVLGVQGQWNAK